MSHFSLELENLNSGLHIYVEPVDLEFVSAGEILDRFNIECDSVDLLTCKPLGLALNPEIGGKRVFYFDDVWVVAYRRNYRVYIIKHSRLIYGPHVAKLCYRSYQTGQIFWIATLQITECMFYNQEQLTQKLIHHVANHDFYISPKSRKDIIAK